MMHPRLVLLDGSCNDSFDHVDPLLKPLNSCSTWNFDPLSLQAELHLAFAPPR